MTVANDIKAAYIEVGTEYNVLGKVSGEYCMYELNAQVTKPFIREHFLDASFPADTQAEPGDVIEFVSDGRKFMVMNKTPDHLENAPIEHSVVLYMTNVSGEIWYSSGEAWGDDYHKVHVWHKRAVGCHALITEALFGHGLDSDEELGYLGIAKNELYIPASYGIQEMDRFFINSGEYYMVTSVRKRRFPGVNVCDLEEDTRP